MSGKQCINLGWNVNYFRRKCRFSKTVKCHLFAGEGCKPGAEFCRRTSPNFWVRFVLQNNSRALLRRFSSVLALRARGKAAAAAPHAHGLEVRRFQPRGRRGRSAREGGVWGSPFPGRAESSLSGGCPAQPDMAAQNGGAGSPHRPAGRLARALTAGRSNVPHPGATGAGDGVCARRISPRFPWRSRGKRPLPRPPSGGAGRGAGRRRGCIQNSPGG